MEWVMLKSWQAIRNAPRGLRVWAESLPRAMRRNISVCESQWALYVTEVRTVIVPGIKAAPWYRKPHKAFAFVEEWFDQMPRVSAYLFAVGVVAWAFTL